MRYTIDGLALQKMLLGAAAMIDQNKQALNDLNVFPVPDGDTGTNMSMTMNAAATELKKLTNPSLTKVADTAASAMLRGARGNSGVILSLLLRGFSKRLKGLAECDGVIFAEALSSGVEAAYKAVMKPAEGTILTVSRLSAAKAVKESGKENCVETVLVAAVARAEKTLAQTQFQNPVLEKAGVVDAGGKGWLFALQAMLTVLRGGEIDYSPEVEAAPQKEQADFSDFDTENITFQYCTEFIVSRENKKDPEKLREFLSKLGDSLVLVDDDEIIKVHVHTNHPGKALEEALKYGSFVTTKIENMKLQHSEKVMNETAEPAAPTIAPPEKKYGIVSVCAGDGLADVFRELGADQIIHGGQTMNPSTQDILEKINLTPSEIVFVFPNNKNIIMAAEQTIGLTEKKVVVIPSKTIPQGIAAMLLFDPELEEAELVDTMTEVMTGVTTMQITYAARDSDFDGHDIHAGEYLALYGGALFGSNSDLDALLKGMAEKVCEDGKEFITLYYGENITEAQANAAADLFSSVCPDAEVNVINGGQPVYYYLISAE